MLLIYNLIVAGIAFVLIITLRRVFKAQSTRRRRRSDQEAVSFRNHQESSILQEPDIQKPLPSSDVEDTELLEWKQIYHKLHHLESNADILPRCRELLLCLFSETLSDALEKPSTNTILSITEFSTVPLQEFLLTSHTNTTDAYEQYVARRRSGLPREMFADSAEAKWWLKQSAPVKYVDGAWLGHINKITTPFALRKITKNAWQVMSEELGDGDLTKNHIHVYRELLDQIRSGLPEGCMEDFIHPRHGLNQKRVWKAAMAQLLISLFPNDFLPEILGFNMAYESLPLHLMKSVKELDELKINSYYFVLHISIDNNDTGHSAMAMQAVLDYLEHVRAEEGEEALKRTWRRVQAGYILAEGLPTTPETPSMKDKSSLNISWTPEEKAVVETFKRKTSASKIHCNSRLKFGDKTLSQWLDPNEFIDPKWQKSFMEQLGNRTPWVIKGDSAKSKLVLEATWGGRMFGAFTEAEVQLVRQWIDSLDQSKIFDAKIYREFTTTEPSSSSHWGTKSNVVNAHPQVDDCLSLDSCLADYRSLTVSTSHVLAKFKSTHSLSRNKMPQFLALWFASSSLLENYPNIPVHVSSKIGCAIVRILRAQYGFLADGDGVAGLDECVRTNDGQAIGLIELGVEISLKAGLGQPNSLEDIVTQNLGTLHKFVLWMLDISMRPLEYGDVLLGLTLAFLELHERMADGEAEWLSVESKALLRDVAKRERENLNLYIDEIRHDQKRCTALSFGLEKGRSALLSL